MERDAMDLREHAERHDTPSIRFGASIVLAVLMAVSGIAMAVIGYGSGDDQGPGAEAQDHRLNLLLSSTIDVLTTSDNITYEDLSISSLLFLMVIDGEPIDDNLTEEVRSRAMFLYQGSEAISLMASSEGFPEIEVFGPGSTGTPTIMEAWVTTGGVRITVTLTIWGYEG
jgi:hypothetical protein